MMRLPGTKGETEPSPSRSTARRIFCRSSRMKRPSSRDVVIGRHQQRLQRDQAHELGARHREPERARFLDAGLERDVRRRRPVVLEVDRDLREGVLLDPPADRAHRLQLARLPRAAPGLADVERDAVGLLLGAEDVDVVGDQEVARAGAGRAPLGHEGGRAVVRLPLRLRRRARPGLRTPPPGSAAASAGDRPARRGRRGRPGRRAPRPRGGRTRSRAPRNRPSSRPRRARTGRRRAHRPAGARPSACACRCAAAPRARRRGPPRRPPRAPRRTCRRCGSWRLPGSTSSSVQPAVFRIASAMASITARSRPSEKLGTHSTSFLKRPSWQPPQ